MPPAHGTPDQIAAAFGRAVAKGWPPREWRDVHVVVAVSGGADSVALLRAMAGLKRQGGGGGRLHVAHFNHSLRGVDSEGDERFVKQLSRSLGLPFHTDQACAADAPASEESAREQRYRFLQATAAEIGARYLATAHTLDDQAETILLRLLRGTGLAGLAGIPAARPLGQGVTVVRPLLGVSRGEVEAYLRSLDQPHRHDATNDQTRFTRNWVRRSLMPMLRERCGEGVAATLAATAEQAAEAHAFIADHAEGLRRQAIKADASGRLVVKVSPMQAAPALVAREALRAAWREAGLPEQAMGRRQWRLLAEQATADRAPEPITLPGGVRVERFGDRLVLAPGGSGFS